MTPINLNIEAKSNKSNELQEESPEPVKPQILDETSPRDKLNKKENEQIPCQIMEFKLPVNGTNEKQKKINVIDIYDDSEPRKPTVENDDVLSPKNIQHSTMNVDQ